MHKRSTCWQLSRKWAQERNWLGWVHHWEPYGGPGLETPAPQPLPKGNFLVFWGHVEWFLSNNTWCIICVGLGGSYAPRSSEVISVTHHNYAWHDVLSNVYMKERNPHPQGTENNNNNNNNKMLHSVVHYQCIFKESIQRHTSPTLDCHCTGHMTELAQ